ncbi:MAG: AAA family ATPase [Desulfobacterales bacterium]|nr:AAA family ATPase [Desulfobacterales bacterium]MBS3756934.1 AAA family ATPase [Desulfobacterales bacterium]
MDYYKLFNLEKEPFSNTPDPDFFFRSTRHAECLQKLEIAIRLRRGLCIVRGEVGTGKTTLCRHLVRLLSKDENIAVHMVLDPGFDRTGDFAAAINEMLTSTQNALSCTTVAEHKEMIKHHLFESGVDNANTTVLIIDEGQKLSAGCAEFLRELLNYETNENKLLQIVVFAQNEIRDLLYTHPNFADRAALYHHLQPLSRKETAQLIQYRLQTAASQTRKTTSPVFTRRGLRRIYRLSRGYPRKIIHLSHNVLLLLLVQGKSRVTPAVVSQAAASLPGVKKTAFSLPDWQKTAGVTAAAALLGLIVMGAYAQWPAGSAPEKQAETAAPKKDPPAEQNPAARSPGPAAAAPESAAESAAENIPSSLGWVRINENENLWNMLKRIYGTSSDTIVAKVKAANPELENPDRIQPGQKIRFPVLNPRPVPKHQHYWVLRQKSESFNRIYQFVFAKNPSDLRVISFWHPAEGLRHGAVKKQPFEKYRDAEQALADKNMPPAAQAEVLDLSKSGMHLLTGGEKD